MRYLLILLCAIANLISLDARTADPSEFGLPALSKESTVNNVYIFGEDMRLHYIETFNESGKELLARERWLWEKSESGNRLKGTLVENKQREPLYLKRFSYDQQGLMIQEEFFGNLSGFCDKKLVILPSGEPVLNGIESRVIINEYSQSKLSAKVSESGNILSYSYDEQTGLVSAKKLFVDGNCVLRQFLHHDGRGFLVSILSDNGIAEEKYDLEGATWQRSTQFTLHDDPQFAGVPCAVEEKMIDLATGIETVLKKTTTDFQIVKKDNGMELRATSFVGLFNPIAATGIDNLQADSSYMNIINPVMDKIAPSLFGSDFLKMWGYYDEESCVGCYGDSELSNRVRVTFINGLFNIYNNFSGSVTLLSETHGNVNIHYIFRATDGWSLDLLKGGFIKTGYISDQAKQLSLKWKQLIREMGGVDGGGMIHHYAHSLGAVDTDAAKILMSPEELAMIRVTTFGAPLLIKNEAFNHVENCVSLRDIVCYFSPFSWLNYWYYGNCNITIVSDPWGMPGFDTHRFNADGYRTVIEERGREFLSIYSN